MAFRIFLVGAVLLGACSESASTGGGASCGAGGSAGSGGDGGSGGLDGDAGCGGSARGGFVSDLEVTSFISGLDKPWDIAWLPNGTVLVTERSGRLNVYVDGVEAEPFTIAPTDLVANGEGGMLASKSTRTSRPTATFTCAWPPTPTGPPTCV